MKIFRKSKNISLTWILLTFVALVILAVFLVKAVFNIFSTPSASYENGILNLGGNNNQNSSTNLEATIRKVCRLQARKCYIFAR